MLGKSPRSSTSRGLGCRRGRRVGTQAALPAHPYEIEFARKEFLEQATRRLSLDRRSAPTDTDVDILIPRPGPAWAVPCSAVAVDQGSHRPSPCLAGKSAEGERRVLAP